MELCLNGHIFPIAQMGPNFIVMRDSINHPPAEAEIAMWIDGREDRWRVRLENGIQAGQRKTVITSPRHAPIEAAVG